MQLVNAHGKPMDDLDVLKLQVAAGQIANAYSISTERGTPICGRVVEGETLRRFVAPGWVEHV